jgi:hypothetical protein
VSDGVASSKAKQHALRAAINTPIQGGAADIAMLAMLELNMSAVLRDLGWKLLMQVHEPASTAGGEPHWGPLTYTTFLALTKATIRKAGVDPDKYAGHSYRRGGATWAMAIGIPIPAIKAIGDWRSEAYLLYCEITAQTRRAAARQMAQALRKP